LSIGTLLSMPRAEGLFRRAIVESGGAQHVSSAGTAQRLGRYIAEKLGVEASLEAIAALPVERLLAAQAELRNELMAAPNPARWGEVATTMLPWQPVIDGDVIPDPPLNRIAAGASADIALIAGNNTEEWRISMVAEDTNKPIPIEAVAGTIMAFGLPVETTLATYRAGHPNAGPSDLLAAIMTDWYWRIPAMHLADAHTSSSAPTYMYEFAWRSPQFNGRLGACHALEIPFVFDMLGNGTEALMGPNPPQQIADAMHADWVAFATNGNPGWPQYDLLRRATMHFDVTPEVVDDPLAAKRALWAGVR
jgi:carboxylesterase type B